MVNLLKCNDASFNYVDEISMKLQFYQTQFFKFFPNILYVIIYTNHKITFVNYTDFVVNYDEDQYIPHFCIQLI